MIAYTILEDNRVTYTAYSHFRDISRIWYDYDERKILYMWHKESLPYGEWML